MGVKKMTVMRFLYQMKWPVIPAEPAPQPAIRKEKNKNSEGINQYARKLFEAEMSAKDQLFEIILNPVEVFEVAVVDLLFLF